MEEQDRYKKLLLAIENERHHEEEYYRQIAKQKTDKEKVAAGILLKSLFIKKKHFSLGDYLEVQLEITKDFDTPNKFKSGIGVLLSSNKEEEVSFKGTLSYKKKKEIGILLPQDHSYQNGLPENVTYKLELVHDERPFKIMRSAILSLIASKEPHIVSLRNGIDRQESLDATHQDIDYPWKISKSLNTTQQKAVKGILASEQMSIIHGPPGTGKTTTLAAVIKALSGKEKKILVCAPSNKAVDLLAHKIDALGVNVLRIGNITRIHNDISYLTLDEKSRNHPDWKQIKQIRIEADAAQKMATTRKRKFGSTERRNRKDMYKESRELRKWAKDVKHKLLKDIIGSSQVIATTLIGVSSKIINDLEYDTVIIDEASQSTEPESWNAILKAKRVILAGDHHQLPPTIKSDAAKSLGLADTLLDRMSDCISYHYLLREQYRMNDKILGFSNITFYNNTLFSNPNNKNHLLKGDNEPLLFIDTSGCGYEEKMHPKSKSIYNDGEYSIIIKHIRTNIEIYKGIQIGIISPYAEQVRYIQNHIKSESKLLKYDIEVNTIDGFQGQEKDLIIISLVRSNPDGNIGFLADYRRLNVAMTRAKKKLVIIGDGATLSSNKLYLKLIDYIEKEGLLRSAWEYMDL